MRTSFAKKESEELSSAAMPRPKKPIKEDAQQHLSVQLPSSLIAAVDLEAERLTTELRVRVTRSDVVRRWIEDGAARRKK